MSKHRLAVMGRLLAVAVPLALLALLPLSEDQYLIYLCSLGMCYAFGALALNVLMGFGSSISLGHAGFFAVGAYTVAIVLDRYGWSLYAGLLAALVIGAVLGAIVALPALRLSGLYLAIGTLAFGLVIERLIASWGEVTGGANGLGVYPPLRTEELYYIVLIAFVLAVVVYRNALSGGYRLVLQASRDHEIAAQSLGINLSHAKINSFVFSAALTSLGGGLYSAVVGFLVGTTFTLDLSLLFILMVMLGGSGSIYGPVVGTAFVVALPEVTKGTGWSENLIYGIAIMLIILFLPRGLAGIARSLSTRLSGHASRKTPRSPTELVGVERGAAR